MKISTFLFINFIVAFFSDIVLNDMSIPSLKPYFQNQSIIKSAFIAGLTIEVCLIITLFFYYFIFGLTHLGQTHNILYLCVISFIIGFILDKLIDKYKIFGSKLDKYYKEFGSGLWGGLAILFSILVSYFIQLKILPYL